MTGATIGGGGEGILQVLPQSDTLSVEEAVAKNSEVEANPDPDPDPSIMAAAHEGCVPTPGDHTAQPPWESQGTGEKDWTDRQNSLGRFKPFKEKVYVCMKLIILPGCFGAGLHEGVSKEPDRPVDWLVNPRIIFLTQMAHLPG